MSLVRKFARTPVGLWLYRQSNRPLAAPVLQPARRMMKEAETSVRRRNPAHRAHDRAAETALAAFERETGT